MAARTAHAPTLADVAEHLGVSRTTVSNAYNRPDQLSPALRERVLAAARDLGYTGPDPVARSLRRGKAGSLGLVFDARLRYIFDDPAAVLFLSGVAAGCEEQGTGLALVPQLPEGAAELVRSALVDGYVMFCTPENDERLEAVRARGLPYVLVDFSPYVDGPRVNIDDRGGARAVAQHLVDLGHRRFGLVAALRGRRDRRRHGHRDLRPDAHRGPHALALLHPLRAPARLARADRRRRHRLVERAGRQLARERRRDRLPRRRARCSTAPIARPRSSASPTCSPSASCAPRPSAASASPRT